MNIKSIVSFIITICALTFAPSSIEAVHLGVGQLAFGNNNQKIITETIGGSVALLASNRSAALGSTFIYPISVDINGYNVGDFQFDVIYDSTVINPAASPCSSVGTLSGSAGISLTCFVSPAGRLNIVGTSSGGTFTGQGVLLNITFTVDPTATAGEFTDISFEFVRFFELTGPIPNTAVTTNVGRITIGGTTAAGASISGRVLSGTGRGVSKARVSLMDGSGNVRNAITNGFGFYRFVDIPVGQTYVVSAFSKSYTFQARTLNFSDDLLDLHFVAQSGLVP